jgi:hypothetical protein
MAIAGIDQNVTPGAEAFERINAYSYFAWPIVLAVTVHRSLRSHAPTAGFGAAISTKA